MRERLMASSMIAGALALAGAGQAAAQAIASAPQGGAQPAGPAGGADSVPAPAAATPAAVKEVVVTGSRIPQPGLTSASPLTVVNDEEIKLEGTTNVEDLLNNLPQAVAAQTSSTSNGATGTATVNLRGLGADRTLVLIDGKRLMPGDPSLNPVGAYAPDLNTIPAQLVDRVEVTTGGASAIYGSDAIAGVVNFIMKKDFQGVRLDVQGGFAQDGNSGDGAVRSAINQFNAGAPNASSVIPIPGGVVDGRKIDVTAIFGANTPDGKGNVTGYVEYRNLQPVTQSSRLGSACSIGTVSSGAMIHGVANDDVQECLGSSNTNFGHFVTSSISPTLGGAPFLNPNGTPNTFGAASAAQSVNPAGGSSFVPFNGALSFNTNPENFFQRDDDRYTAGFFAHYDVNKTFNLYSDFMFSDDQTVGQIAPSGAFQGAGANGASTLGVNCNNPLLSPQQQQALCGTLAGTSNVANLTAGFRYAQAGPRQADLRHTDYKIDIGSKGEIAPGWTYDAYLQYGTSIYAQRYLNDVSLKNLQAGLLVNPATGQCMAGSPAGCVPVNIFALNALSPQAIAFTSVPGFEAGQTTEQVASASVTGDLGQYGWRSPLATSGIGLALGGEYRREALVLNTDQEFSTGDLAGQGGPVLGNSGSFDVYELFGEVRVPLVQDKPFVRNLSVDGAYRFSDYSTVGTTDTYEAQFTYNMNRDIGFRGGYSRAVRAPNVNELFAAKQVNLFSGNDPCAGSSPTATLAQCQRTGVTAAQFNSGAIQQCPIGQCSQLIGGNPNLQPEKSDTFTLGAIFTPTESFLRGFTLTVDWFDIIVRNLITAGPGGSDVTLTQCLQTGNPTFCNLIHRDPLTGDLFGDNGFVTATNVNTGFLRTEGVDVEASDRWRFTDLGLPDYGSLSFHMDGTYTYEYIFQPGSGGGTFNCAGLFGSDKCQGGGSPLTSPLPRWRHTARLTWSPPYPFTLSLQWRFIDGMRFDGNSNNVFLNNGEGFFDTADKLPTVNYLDISATWRIRDGLTARMGVNNVLGTNFPVVDSANIGVSGPPSGNGNTFPGLYDALGREFFFGLTADF